MISSSITLATGLPRGHCHTCSGNLVYRRDHLNTIYRQCLQCGRIRGEWPLPVLHKNQDRTLPYRLQRAAIIADIGPPVTVAQPVGDSPRQNANTPHGPAAPTPPPAKVRRRNLNVHEETLAISLLDRAMDPRIVAEQFQCTVTAVKRLFPRTRTRHRKTRTLDDAQLTDIRQLRQQGVSVSDLALHYGVKTHMIRYYSDKPHRGFPQADIHEANHLLANGFTPSQVASHFHIPRQYVHRFCRRDHLQSPETP